MRLGAIVTIVDATDDEHDLGTVVALLENGNVLVRWHEAGETYEECVDDLDLMVRVGPDGSADRGER